MTKFKLESAYKPAGDQPSAIKQLLKGLKNKEQDQVLLGVTGSGKTFAMAHIIADQQKPALILAHNKTLAAQLYGEMKEFFPHNAVEYFVSYYDYYQPEAYIPKSDTYIEKDSSINEQIDLMRHSTTRSLLERKDVIVIASVSCIYGLGSPALYSEMTLKLSKNATMKNLVEQLVNLQYERNDVSFVRGKFRIRGDSVDIFPSHLEDRAWRLSLFGDEIEHIHEFDPLTGKKLAELTECTLYAKSHFVTPEETVKRTIVHIKEELEKRIEYFSNNNLLVESQRIAQKTRFDIEMLTETGSCKGIENYSRYLTGRPAGAPPPTLFEYFPKDALLFVDESHVTVPQIGAMYNGDKARKDNLIEHGFRLPSARDNRPLQFAEWDGMRPKTIFVSATPGKFELERTKGKYIEQIIRPTGLLDPLCEIRPLDKQVDDLIEECRATIAQGFRILVTALTKKMAEHLSDYMTDIGFKVSYIHSDVKTLERVEIIYDLRQGVYDVLIGVNLLREGLDIPECGLIAILDADKEGFLRSETSLIQTIGRAARNSEGRVILYANRITNSMEKALNETNRRREIQLAHNTKHNITPTTIKKDIIDILGNLAGRDNRVVREVIGAHMSEAEIRVKIQKLRKEMFAQAANLEFEKASRLRDEVEQLERIILA